MKGTKEILILIFGYYWTIDVSHAETTYRVMETQESWEDAWFSCQNISGSLVPDLGTKDIANQLLPLMPANEMLWLFAKQITLEYEIGNKSSFRYAQLSYRSADTELEDYLCPSATEKLPPGKYAWRSVRDFCERRNGSLMKVMIKQLRSLMAILKDDMEFWINKYDRYTLPSSESPLETVQCVGIIKESPKTFIYKTFSCFTELRYICDISPNNANKYAPTLKRKSTKFPVYMPEKIAESSNFSEEINGNKQVETINIALIVGPVACGFVIFIVVLVVVVYKRKKKRQEKYRKRRERYFSGRTKRTAASIQNGDIQHIDRDGTLGSLTSDKNSVISGMDKGRYVHLHEDSTISTTVSEGDYEGQVDKKSINIDQPGYYLMEIKSSRPSYINKKAAIQLRYVCLHEDTTLLTMINGSEGQYEGQVNKKSNIDQQGYYLMEIKSSLPSYVNKKAAKQVPMCYESFNPDPVQLKEQIKSIKNKDVGNVQVRLPSDLKKSTEIKKIPLKPVKGKQDKQDSSEYKEPRASKPPMLPVKKFKGARYLENRRDAAKEEKPTVNSSKQPLPVNNENRVTQEPEMYASKNLGDTNQCSHGNTKPEPNIADHQVPCLNDLETYGACSQNPLPNDATSPLRLDDLDAYENSNTPPTKQNTGNQRSPISAKKQGLNQPGLNDLEAYENFDMPSADNKGTKTGQTQSPNISHLDDLDQYESFEPQQTKKNDDVLWKDIDNYENLPIFK